MLTRFKVKTSLRVYTCIVKISRNRETFEIDVYDGDPGFNDRPKFLGECMWIGGYEDYEFTHPLKPVEIAKKVIDEWERPQRLENYLRLKNYFLRYNEEDGEASRQEAPPRPVIHDFEEKSRTNYISYLKDNPQEIDTLPETERKKLLKENLSLRLSYHEYRARQQAAQQRQQQRQTGGNT